MHVHSCTILKCLDAHGGCAIVIQDIMKRVKTQNQAWLVCHLYHFLSQKQTLNVVKLGLTPVMEKICLEIYKNIISYLYFSQLIKLIKLSKHIKKN